MDQSAGRAHHADNKAADEAVQDGEAEQPHQPDTHTQKPLETEQLWTLFQVDQQRIGALDTIMMTIRGWTVTLVAALVSFSLTQHHHSLLLVAMAGTVFFGLFDAGFRRTQILHADRANNLEKVIAPGYRLRPNGYSMRPSRLALFWSRYRSPISFYVVVLFLLLLLLIAT
jgi:uncharacterized membrane protein